MDIDFSNISTTDACGIDNSWEKTILIIRCGIAGTALLCCVLVLILAVYFVCREREWIHLPTLRLVIYITCSSMARSVIIVVQIMAIGNSTFSNFYYCIITGYLYRTFSFVALLFTLMASVHTLLATFRKNNKKLEPIYVLVPLILPQTFIWIPLIYDKAVMEAWCSIKSNNTCEQQLLGFIYNVDIPRFVIELVNTIIVIITIFGMPGQYRKLRESGEDFHCWLQQVLPILIYSVIYLALNWFSLSDHINRKFKIVRAEALKVTHSVTSASHGLVVGIVFTAYLLIMLRISIKYRITVNRDTGYATTPSNSSIGSTLTVLSYDGDPHPSDPTERSSLLSRSRRGSVN